MNFERHIDPKEALGIGLPVYIIYRMLIFQVKSGSDMGFYIMQYKKTRETLEKLSRGELSRSKYIVEFAKQYESLENKVEISLCELHTCILRYHNKDYVMKSHIPISHLNK